MTPQLHTFHIPVMGLAFTVDSPIKVARFGINSVVSIIEDKLIELMRRHYYQECKLPYVPIPTSEPDYRAKRITDYLNLMNRIVREQIETLRNSVFEKGSEIVKYFEMLPDESGLRVMYEKMKACVNATEKESLTEFLRSQISAGRIDVNIMTKVDKNNVDREGNIIADSSDALAALRGFANSDLRNSSVVFSAGLNPRLFNYLEKLPAFQSKGWGEFEKEVVIKVSDFRSAIIQGKYLAKKGIWVSEFRIESGLNCGGHAFATDGSLLGPILEEFKQKRHELATTLHGLYNAALVSKGSPVFEKPHPIRLTVQGGIGTHSEDKFLRTEYEVDGTGWGTPFLLCPEATTVDDKTLQLLCAAREQDVMLSKNSPLGVRFNYLMNTSSDLEKAARIKAGKPGSPCTEKHLVSNTEFTKDPICTASAKYQQYKIAQLQTQDITPKEYEKQYKEVVAKECLCLGLSNSAIEKYHLPPVKNLRAVTICPGPNIVYFDKVVSLWEMTDHIYGKSDILDRRDRPHMFIKELALNVEYFQEQGTEQNDDKQFAALSSFGEQLLKGIAYYRSISEKISRVDFLSALEEWENVIMETMSAIIRNRQPVN